MKIFAHRGASGNAPENTMAAFKKAYDQGADGIELDVQLTLDKVPVIIHDETLTRTAGISGFVKDFTWKELQQLDFGSWYSNEYENESIPSLEEFLNWVKKTNLIINIELKNNVIPYGGIEDIVQNQINSLNLHDRVIVSSFNHTSLQKLKSLDRNIKIAPLTSAPILNPWGYAKKLGADGIHYKFYLLSNMFVKMCHLKGIAIRTYTVNDPSQIKKCIAWNIDGIFTDFPLLARTIRTKKS